MDPLCCMKEGMLDAHRLFAGRSHNAEAPGTPSDQIGKPRLQIKVMEYRYSFHRILELLRQSRMSFAIQREGNLL